MQNVLSMYAPYNGWQGDLDVRMIASDRATNSLRNARYAMLFYVVGFIASFFFRRYFIQVLGDELLGMNSTLTSILGFLNIAELGFSGAIAFALYEPLAQDDRQQVQEIISIQAWFYRWVARVVLLASVALLFFFPRIFAETHIPLWYAYATFIVLLANALWGYLFNFRQIIFSSDQQEYKITLAVQIPRILKQVLQVLAILFLAHPYVWWLALEFFIGLLGVLFFEWLIRRDYPWLKASAKQGGLLRHRYPDIMRRTGQLIYHKVATFVLQQSAPIVILIVFGSMQGFSVVTIYQNYSVLFLGISGIVSALFNGLTASVGNLVIEGDQNRVEALFRKLYSFRLWFILVIGAVVYWGSQSFMELWVGGERYFGQLDLLLFLLYMFLQLSRLPEQFIAAYGMYQDIYAPIIEAILNLGLSLLFGSMWGITGVLLGINISLVAIVLLWRPYFLYSQGFHRSVWGFHLRQTGHLALAVLLVILLGRFLPQMTDFASISSWGGWFVRAMLCTVVYSLLFGGGLYLLFPDFRGGIGMIINKVFRRR